MEKLKVILHVGDTAVVKLWRFNPSNIVEYSRNEVEAMMIDLFPDVQKKGLRLEMSYEDELGGKITIESNGDMLQALRSFTESSQERGCVEYRTLHLKECTEIRLERGSYSEVNETNHNAAVAEPKEPPTKKRKISKKNVQKEADNDLNQLHVPDLVKVLSKCATEEKTDDDGQPLYIDDSCDMIKCKWCPNFKGSTEARVINQHSKSSKNHITRRRQLLGEDPLNRMQGLQSIKKYFKPSCSDI